MEVKRDGRVWESNEDGGKVGCENGRCLRSFSFSILNPSLGTKYYRLLVRHVGVIRHHKNENTKRSGTYGEDRETDNRRYVSCSLSAEFQSL